MQKLNSDELLDKICIYFHDFVIPYDKYIIRIGSLCEMFKELQFQQRRDIDLHEISNAICRYTERMYKLVTNNDIKCRNINSCCDVYAQIDDNLDAIQKYTY